MKLLEDMEELMADGPYIGQECRDRCPAGQELATYVCHKDNGNSILCVCSRPRSQVSEVNANMRGAAVDAAGTFLDGLIDSLEEAIQGVLTLLDTLLQNLIKDVKNLFDVVRAVSSTVKDTLSGLPL